MVPHQSCEGDSGLPVHDHATLQERVVALHALCRKVQAHAGVLALRVHGLPADRDGVGHNSLPRGLVAVEGEGHVGHLREAPVFGRPLRHAVLEEGQELISLDAHHVEQVRKRQELDEVLDGELSRGIHHVRAQGA